MSILRRFPAMRLRAKLWLLVPLMYLAAWEADDERNLARDRQGYGKACLWAVRYHRRLSALLERTRQAA